MSVQKHPTQNHAPRARRQNHSCDQCRKSKRACDATTGQRSPCSYCARTKKRCTTEWARSRAQSSLKSSRQQPHLDILTREILPWMADQPQVQGDVSSLDSLLDFNPAEDLLGWDCNPAASGPSLSYDLLSLDPVFNDPRHALHQEQAEASDALTPAQCVPNVQLDFCNIPDSTQLPDLGLDPTPSHQSWQTPLTYNTVQYASSSGSRRPSDISWMPFAQKSPAQTSARTNSLSPFSIDQQMISASNSHLTSANLLQIYHDVLEHNLSCWLTEQTCPYKRGWQGSTAKAVPEWGSFWSNRIYQRTIKLDRVAQSCKLVSMTKSEERSASKALHLSIMAFATQWAQGSQRHREKYSNTFLDSCSNGSTTEFDRVLQNHFWDQARRALQEVADVESYQVVCAELIFALTQRPWETDQENTSNNGEEQGQQSQSSTALSRVRDILQKDGPPVHIERAARKMHALKYRCDAVEAGLRRGKEVSTSMDPEDRASISLLYWLAIMFDTVSASMNERPVVIQDEECQHEAEPTTTPRRPPPQTQSKTQLQSRWDMDLFVPGGLDKTTQTHWPCTYSEAAEDITKSAPAKVLLFRHVSYLQNAVRKGADSAIIEDVIHSTISLYKHWNKTHGAFFAEMVSDYNTVPQRIQGWFVCISAHWHLGTLLFADLLDFVHENDLGAQNATIHRIEEQIAARIRKHSSGELADLARVATPATMDSSLGAVPQMPDFHHAVNEGTLLTEPWTMIPIRAFTKACVIFLDAAEELCRFPGGMFVKDSDSFARNVEQAEDCIKGLWLLGKKSDMARKIAETLSGALARLRHGV